jgi:hypothetical protein
MLFLLGLVAAIGVATGALTAWAASSGVVFGSGPVAGKSLIRVAAVGEGSSSTSLTSTSKTPNYDDAWQTFSFDANAQVHGLSFTVPNSTHALVVMRVSAASQCSGNSGSDPYVDYCAVRLLLDGTPYGLVNGSWQPTTFPTEAPTQLEAQEFAANVGPGSHHVVLQWAIFNGTGTNLRFAIQSVRLVVEVYRQA